MAFAITWSACHNIVMKNQFSKLLKAAFILSAFALFTIPNASAEEKCAFIGDLELGSIGEEVRCLQKYLNRSGFYIADIGAGSIGKETDTFREKTKDAVRRWQVSMGISPATGNFGPLSRATYNVKSVVSSVPVQTTSTIIPGTTSTVTTVPSQSPVSVPIAVPVVSQSSADKTMKALIKSIKDAMDDAEESIDDAEDDGEDVADMRDMLERARDKFIEGVYLYVTGENAEAETTFKKADSYIENSIEDLDGGDKGEAEEAIADAKEAMLDAQGEIDDAEEDDEDIDEAEDIYSDAKAKYNDAREAFDNDEYEDAVELANDAEDLFEEAIDAL